MKTKLTLLITALAFAGVTSIARAGPDLQTLELRKKIADSHRASTAAARSDSGPAHYVASSSGKGGTVVAQKSGQPMTTIALFKSKKPACCENR